MTISVKTCLVRTTSEYIYIYLISQHCLHSPRNGSPKFQTSVVSRFGITALESRKNKEINLYSDYTKNKPQALAFAAITSIWISVQSWNLAYNFHHGLADQLGIVLALHSPVHRRRKAVLLKKNSNNFVYVYCSINKLM